MLSLALAWCWLSVFPAANSFEQVIALSPLGYCKFAPVELAAARAPAGARASVSCGKMSHSNPSRCVVIIELLEILVANDLQEIAFYYPGHLWQEFDAIKNLLLFFDGIGLLVPDYKWTEPALVDPVLAGTLEEKGLLHKLRPENLVDATATEALFAAVNEMIESGAFARLDGKDGKFHALSRSRMGFYGAPELAQRLFELLRARGLARESEDGLSVPLHPMVRYFILVVLAQILRPKGPQLGLDLSPMTDRAEVVGALTEILALPMLPSAGNVVSFDLQQVSVDLGAVPIDEILSFREDHREDHRRYARAVRAFTRELSLLPPEDRASALVERQAQLNDLASDLQRRAKKAWRKPLAFALGIAGAAWTLHTGNLVGALLGGGALLARGIDLPSSEAGAFSYLFAAGRRYAQ